MRTIYRTYVNGDLVYQGRSLESAIREWDFETYNLGRSVPGGISVAAYIEDIQVRDGWILHVHDNGTVYLHPMIGES